MDEFYVALRYGASLTIGGGPIVPTDIYSAGQHIACLHIACLTTYDSGICLFMEGNVPKEGVRGSVIIDRVGDLNSHGCWYCGSVPISGDNKPEAMGVLTSNWVRNANCETRICKVR